jgi:serine/threonine protein kinase
LGAEPPLEAIGRGSVPYVAPELCRGEAPPSASTDRYALSAIVARMIIGDAVFPELPRPALVVRIGERGLDTSRLASLGLPTPFASTLAAYLAPDPADRPGDLAALRAALDILRAA